MTVDAGLSITRGGAVHRLRFAGAFEVSPLTRPNVSVMDVSVLSGARNRRGRLVLSGAAGLGYTHVVQRGEYIGLAPNSGFIPDDLYERVAHHTVGMAFEAQLLGAGQHLGAGVALSGNLNLYVPTAALLFVVHVGAL
jgi:hypothetical protein